MNTNSHVHLWDTETDEFSTFTPDPQLDDPWVIHECCMPGCDALKIERPIWGEGRKTLVYEVAAEGEERDA